MVGRPGVISLRHSDRSYDGDIQLFAQLFIYKFGKVDILAALIHVKINMVLATLPQNSRVRDFCC